MTPNDRPDESDETPGNDSDPEYDNWPISDRERSETKWIGFYGAPTERESAEGLVDSATIETQTEHRDAERVALLFDPERESVFHGRVDTEKRRIEPIADTERELDEEETLTDLIDDVGERFGWTSLSSYARNLDSSEDRDDVYLERTYQRQNVAATDPHQLAFFGSYTLQEAEGDKRTVEHEFSVFTDDEHRTDDGRPVAEVMETHLHTSDDSDGGEILHEAQTEMEVEIDPELSGRTEEQAVEAFFDEWHERLPESGFVAR